MSQQITDLGKGLGYIYVTEPGGTSSDIIKVFNNTKSGVREAKLYGVQGTSTALNRKASATITIDTVTGVGQINSITTATGTNIIDTGSPIAYTGATTTSALASLVAAAINSFIDLAAPSEDCTAIADANIVYVYASEEAGATLNGTSLIVTDTGNMTNTVTPFANGSDNTELYDKAFGYRFFLNADYDATGCSGLGTATENSLTNAWEITSYIIPRSLNSANQIANPTISGGVIYVERKSSDILMYVETESFAASDDLDSIRVDGYANGDRITIRGNNSGRVTTVKHGTGNIELQSGADFVTADYETTLILSLKDSTWYEVSRSNTAVGSMSDYRTAGYGFFGVDEFNTAGIAASGTITFTAGTSDKLQELTGSQTLSGNTTYDLAAGAVNGDSFTLRYDASVDLNGFTLDIFGISLTSDMALNGGLMFFAEYKEGAWKSWAMINMDRGVTYPYVLPTEMYKDESITISKLETSLQKGFFVTSVSWETNETGIISINIPFDCTVDEAVIAVSGLIEATDDATLVLKNNAGTAMTGGSQTITAGTLVGNNFTLTPTANNTFTAGQVMKFETIKTTKGGRAEVSVTYTRT